LQGQRPARCARGRRSAVAAVLMGAVTSASAGAAACPTSLDPARFATADDLWALEETLDGYGVSATGNPSAPKRTSLGSSPISRDPGVDLRTIDYPIQRWTENVVGLRSRRVRRRARDGPGQRRGSLRASHG